MVIQHRLFSFLSLATVFQVAGCLHCGFLAHLSHELQRFFLKSALIKDLSAFQAFGSTQPSFSHTCLLSRQVRNGEDATCVCHLSLSCGSWKGRMPYGLEDSN